MTTTKYKQLDLAAGHSCNRSLANALQNPDGIYISLDIEPLMIDPINFCLHAKSSLLWQVEYSINRKSQQSHQVRRILCAISSVAIYFLETGVIPSPEIIEYHFGKKKLKDNHMKILLAELRQYTQGNVALDSKVSEYIPSDQEYLEKYKSQASIGIEDADIFRTGIYDLHRVRKELFRKYEHYSIEDIIKIPIPEEMKERVKHALSRVWRVQGDIRTPPFRDQSFDNIIGTGPAILGEELVIKEAQRILKRETIKRVQGGIDTIILK